MVTKSHSHVHDKTPKHEPHIEIVTKSQRICPKCKGARLDDRGYPCMTCFGDGVIFEIVQYERH